MVELFDTHAHFEGDENAIEAAVQRAAEEGVTRIMAVGGSPELNETTKGFAYRAIGWDRDMAGKDTDPLDYTGVAAVGEIGLDYHYSPENAKEQRELFALQLETARAFGLPVVIHTRDADDDTLGILREIPSRGVIHCFTGSPKFCRALLDLGFMISISGIVTFNAADNVRESALVVPDDRILIETDSPFLAPVPLRGQTNEPAFLTRTAAFLADVRRTAVDALAALTYANAVSLLG